MKKIITLIFLVILLVSCGAKKEPTVQEIDAAVKKSMERQDISEPETQDVDTWTDSTADNWITVESANEDPVKEEPVKVEAKPENKVTSTKPDPVIVTPPKTTITKAEVALHNTKSDCYTIIDAKVYDITSFFGKHPGGDEKIIWLCWIDWSAKFKWVHWKNEKAIMTKDKYFKANLGN